MLLVFDLSNWISFLSRKRIVDKIKPLIDDEFILNLVNSFLHSPILDMKGKNLAYEKIPPVRFLRPLLFHFFLDDLDRKILSKLPNWTFARFYHHMLIPIENNFIVTEENLVFIQNAFMDDDAVKLHILKPRDGKVFSSCIFEKLVLNQYGRPIVSMSEYSKDPKI